MLRFTIAWLLWVLAFAVIETLAYRAGKGTLSEHLSHWFQTHTRRGQWAFTIATLLSAVALTRHIIDFSHKGKQ